MTSMACIYCGAADASTVDHVPPKLLLPKPYPDNLITVPACLACNRSFQTDDEYFRAALPSRYGVDDTAAGLSVIERFGRAIERPEGRGLTTALVKAMNTRNFWTPDGVSFGPQPVLEVDAARLTRTLARIVRGLYWNTKHGALPARVEVKAHLQLEFDRESVRLLEQILAGASLRFVGTAFSFAWREVPEHPYFTAWLLDFYGAAQFSVFTVDPLAHPQASRPDA